jgi:hypothetical protein
MATNQLARLGPSCLDGGQVPISNVFYVTVLLFSSTFCSGRIAFDSNDRCYSRFCGDSRRSLARASSELIADSKGYSHQRSTSYDY